MFDTSRREIIKRINFLEREIKQAEDLQINFKNFKETYQEELWGKMPKFAEKLENEIKQDLNMRLLEMMNSTIDLGIQLPQRDPGDPGDDPDDYDSDENRDPNCPWYNQDTLFDNFDENKIQSLIQTEEKYLLGVFPYGPNNQLRGFRDTI